MTDPGHALHAEEIVATRPAEERPASSGQASCAGNIPVSRPLTSVPLYYLHLRSDTELIHDPEDIDLVDLDAARRECILNIRSLVADDALTGIIDLASEIDVEDENGRPVLTVRFDEAVQVKH